jgi:hypothetical protein
VTQPREPGYYWVIIDEGYEPEIAYCDEDCWFPVGSEAAAETT